MKLVMRMRSRAECLRFECAISTRSRTRCIYSEIVSSDLELPLRVRLVTRSPYQVFYNLDQVILKCQVVNVLVLFDFVKMFRNNLHKHELHKGFRCKLIDCEVRFHLVNQVFNRQVCSTFLPLNLALHFAA